MLLISSNLLTQGVNLPIDGLGRPSAIPECLQFITIWGVFLGGGVPSVLKIDCTLASITTQVLECGTKSSWGQNCKCRGIHRYRHTIETMGQLRLFQTLGDLPCCAQYIYMYIYIYIYNLGYL